MEPIRIARGIVTSHENKRARHFSFDPFSETNRAFPFRREIALQSDHIRPERLADRHSIFRTVDPKVDDLAFVPVAFQARGDTDRPERLNEREHFESQNAANGRLDEGNLHAVTPEPRLTRREAAASHRERRRPVSAVFRVAFSAQVEARWEVD